MFGGGGVDAVEKELGDGQGAADDGALVGGCMIEEVHPGCEAGPVDMQDLRHLDGGRRHVE